MHNQIYFNFVDISRTGHGHLSFQILKIREVISEGYLWLILNRDKRRAMITLYKTNDEKLHTQLDNLRKLFIRQRSEIGNSERKKFRKVNRRIIKVLNQMALRTIYPALIPRTWKIITNGIEIKVPDVLRGQFINIARATLIPLSWELAKNLKIDPKIREAFTTLNLTI